MQTNRRQFIAAAGLATAAIGTGCQSLPTRGLTIIDVHPHFYDPTRPKGVPWPPATDKFLSRPTYPADYRNQEVRRAVTGVVVVEASDRVADNQWVLDLAAQDKFIVGLCGNLPLGMPEFAEHLKRFAANELWTGMRHRQRDLAADLENPDFMRDAKLLADNGKQLDMLARYPLLPLVNRLAKAVPDLRIVIDHFANPRIDGQNVDPEWEANIREVATNHNVTMKVSGLVEGSGKRDGNAPQDVGFYKPWIDVVWDSFGPDRLVYGSNWPVSARFASLATVQALVHDYFADQGTTALRKVFSENARRVYRWVDRA